jgi:hypothetical protein
LWKPAAFLFSPIKSATSFLAVQTRNRNKM